LREGKFTKERVDRKGIGVKISKDSEAQDGTCTFSIRGEHNVTRTAKGKTYNREGLGSQLKTLPIGKPRQRRTGMCQGGAIGKAGEGWYEIETTKKG